MINDNLEMFAIIFVICVVAKLQVYGVVILKFKRITLFMLMAVCFISFATMSHAVIISEEDFRWLILTGEFGAVSENDYAEKYRNLRLLRNEATAMGGTPMNRFRSSLESKCPQGFLQSVLVEFDYVFDHSDLRMYIVSNFNNISMAYRRLGDLDDLDMRFNNQGIQALQDAFMHLEDPPVQQQDDESEEEEEQEEEEEEEEE